jgi:hypothetical protein
VAKTTGQAIGAIEKTGGFLKEVFGNLIVNAVGLASDKLGYYRLEKCYLLQEKMKTNLKVKGINTTHFVSPKIGIPLIEHATIEDNEDLHTRWANMLANAMNPEFKGSIKRSYVSILADMEALDVLILDSVVKEYMSCSESEKDNALFDRDLLTANLASSDPNQCDVSLRNLIRLGCFKPGVINSEGAKIGQYQLSSYQDTKFIGVTSLGVELYKAVN